MKNVSDIPLDDQKTWDMICEGRVKGCFQIESSLGKSWCKKVKPRNISELSDLISIIRPGVLKFYYDGKSMAQHYADRKNGIDDAKPLHEELREILKETHQVLLYQEQIMKIARHIAGFSEGEADSLRKSVGKKDAELLFSLEQKFIDGCVKVGEVNAEEAKLIFSNIKASARYLFNKCWSPDTLVETESGEMLTLDEIEIGEKIRSPEGFTTVINKYDNGEKDLYEFTLESGRSVKCTIDHKFLCEDGCKRPLFEIIDKDYRIVCS